MQYLDGKRLQRAVTAGSLWLGRNREGLNAINVFPVADGDTGTNMALTLHAAVAGAKAAKSNSLHDVADSIALHSLRGARGNSGVIMSQYFKGIADFVRQKDRLPLPEVAGVFSAGAESAYMAMTEPKEGTILTVLREIADHLKDAGDRFVDLLQLLESAVDKGKVSLAETKNKLRVLAEADVVDAGAQGFVHFIDGIYRFIKTGEMAGETDQAIPVEDIPEEVAEHSKYRYCSEFLVKGVSFDTVAVKSALAEMGDSLIVAGAAIGKDSYLRIHIHTDNPDLIKEYALKMGVLENTKIEDMKAQNESMRKWRMNFRKSSKKTIRIVTDSTSDLPADIAAFHDIEVVPLNVIYGDRVYRDGIDMDKDAFYKMLIESPEFPKTSQPSPERFAESYRRVFSRGDADTIISIHVSSRLSGTYNSALKASEEFSEKIIHFDTESVSLGLGLMAIKAAEMAKNGRSPKEIIAVLNDLKRNNVLYFTLETVDYLVKGGRIGRARGFVGRILGLKPVLTLVDGEVAPLDKARDDEKILRKILSHLPEHLIGGKLAVAHAADPAKIDFIKRALGDKFDVDDILVGEIGPTVGAHTGPGTWGLFFMKG